MTLELRRSRGEGTPLGGQCRGHGHGSGKGQLGLAGESGQRSSFLGRLSELCGPQSAARPDTNEGAWLCSRTTPRKSGDQWLLAPELRREEGPEVAGLPPRNQSGLGAWGLPSCKVAGALETRGLFQCRPPSQSPAAMETTQALGSLICEAGVWPGPTPGGAGAFSTMLVVDLTHMAPVMETGALSQARASVLVGWGTHILEGASAGLTLAEGECVLGPTGPPHPQRAPCSCRVPLRPSQPQEWEDGELVILPQEGEDVPVLHPAPGEGPELLLGGAVRGGPEHTVRGHGALPPAAAAHHGAVYVAGPALPGPASCEPLPVRGLWRWGALRRTPVPTKVPRGGLCWRPDCAQARAQVPGGRAGLLRPRLSA